MFLKDKVVLVTGASRGIGKAIALNLGQQGAFIIGTGINEEEANDVTEYLKAANLTGQGLPLLVEQPESREELFSKIKEIARPPQVLVNNAGITRDNLFIRMKDDEWNSVININLNGVYHMSKLCVRGMMKERWGRIINISSIVALIGNAGQPNYCASKAGVLGLTKSLAQEIASRGITVNAVAPGFIDTEMTRKLTEEQRKLLLDRIPLNRAGTPEDVAAAVNFLASPAADYITGQTLHVNGGMVMI